MLGNDHWTLDLAALGMDGAGDALARRTLTCRPPYAICVQGKWGSGKTSLMRYAMARLGGQPLANTLATAKDPTKELPIGLRDRWDAYVKMSDEYIEKETTESLGPGCSLPKDAPLVVPIWFNPWQHQRAELPVVGLLHELREQFTALAKLEEKVKKVGNVAIEAALPLLGKLADGIAALQGGLALGAGAAFANVRKAGEAYEKRNFETKEDAQRLNLMFEEAVRRLLGAADLKDEEVYVEIGNPAEAKGADGGATVHPIGNFFPLRRLVIFIDDLDRCGETQTVHLLEAIKLYLQTPYCVFVLGMDGTAARRAVAKVLGQSDAVAREYLEKLFQSTVHVPVPQGGQGFVCELLQHSGLHAERTGCDAGEMAGVITALIESNPRKLKAFVSNLEAGWIGGEMGEGEDVPVRERALDQILLAYLRTVHPDVFRLLSHDPAQVGRLHEVLSRKKIEASDSPVHHFFHRSFRHAFETLYGEAEEPRRADSDVAVDELVRRLDHVTGDRAFIARWDARFGEAKPAELEGRFWPLLSRDPRPAPPGETAAQPPAADGEPA